MARLCSCSAKISLPTKRNFICTTDDPRANQFHSPAFCVEVWHGRNEHTRGRALPDPFNFHLLGKATS